MAPTAVVGLSGLSGRPDSGDESAFLLSNSTLFPRKIACENSISSNLFDLSLPCSLGTLLMSIAQGGHL